MFNTPTRQIAFATLQKNAAQFFMPWRIEWFCEDICKHILGGAVFNTYFTTCYLLTRVVIPDVNVLGPCIRYHVVC